MLEIFKKLSARDKVCTNALRGAMKEIDIAKLQDAIATAEQRRRELLLTGTDAEVVAAEREIAAAKLAVERGKAAVDELNARIVDADRAEADAALMAARDAVQLQVDKLAIDLKREWAKHQRALYDLLTRVCEVSEIAGDMNNKLRAAGKTDLIEDPEW